MTFTIPTPIPTFDMAKSVAFKAAEWDFSKLLPIAMSVYSDPFGNGGQIIVYGSIFLSILVAIAIRQDNMLIPMIVLEVFAQAIYWGGFIPEAWGFWVVDLIFIIPIAGIGYTLYTTKRR